MKELKELLAYLFDIICFLILSCLGLLFFSPGCGAVYVAHRHSQQHGELPLSAIHVNQRQLPEQLSQQPGRRFRRQWGDGHDAGGRAHRHLQQLGSAQTPGECKLCW